MEKREIKFRYWNKKRMIDFNQMVDDHWDLGDLDSEFIMQFTGVKDKTGKDIYEGDIIKYALDNMEPETGQTEYIEEVTFSDGMFCLDNYTPVSIVNDWPCEIVGNVFETPELIARGAV